MNDDEEKNQVCVDEKKKRKVKKRLLSERKLRHWARYVEKKREEWKQNRNEEKNKNDDGIK